MEVINGTYSLGSPELDLLLVASRERIDEPCMRRLLSLLPLCSDPHYFYRQCAVNKTLPMVAHALRDIEPPTNSCSFLDEVRRALHRHMKRRWIPHRKRLVTTVMVARETLAGKAIPHIFFRGISLADAYYSNPLLRMNGDVDVLVPEDRREEAESALVATGFEVATKNTMREAMRSYVGQIEFRHCETKVGLDLNWRLSANGQAGGASPDMTTVWRRAAAKGDGSYVLAPEDLLLDLIRHVAQGHDFEISLLHCAADVGAVLRRHAAEMDWEYFGSQAQKCSCNRAVAFFVGFYERCYRDHSLPTFRPYVGYLEEAVGSVERSLFIQSVLVPQIRQRVRGKSKTSEVYAANLSMVAKFWMAENVGHLVRLLGLLYWPSREVAMLLLYPERLRSTAALRLYANLKFSWLVTPGVACGCFARFLSWITFAIFPRRKRRGKNTIA